MQLSLILKELSEFGAVSGDEFRLSNRITEAFGKFDANVTQDSLGNVIMHKKGGEGGKRVMLYTHFDEPGLVIKSSDDKGFLKFSVVGGIDIRDLASQEVYVYGKKKILGLIGLRPPHILTDKERSAPVTWDELNIDIGYRGEKVSQLVQPGDTVTVKRDFARHLGNEVCGKALCDRAGVAVFYEMMRNAQLCSFAGIDLYMVFGTRNYCGHTGVLAAAKAVKPDAAIIVDSLEGKSRMRPHIPQCCGGGPAVCLGPNVHPALSRSVMEFAKKHLFDYQVKASAGLSDTDMWALQVAFGGVPLSQLMIPVKYRYSSVEELNLSDITKTAELLNGYLSQLGDDWGNVLCC